jgi:hypothetical protein
VFLGRHYNSKVKSRKTEQITRPLYTLQFNYLETTARKHIKVTTLAENRHNAGNASYSPVRNLLLSRLIITGYIVQVRIHSNMFLSVVLMAVKSYGKRVTVSENNVFTRVSGSNKKELTNGLRTVKSYIMRIYSFFHFFSFKVLQINHFRRNTPSSESHRTQNMCANFHIPIPLAFVFEKHSITVLTHIHKIADSCSRGLGERRVVDMENITHEYSTLKWVSIRRIVVLLSSTYSQYVSRFFICTWSHSDTHHSR